MGGPTVKTVRSRRRPRPDEVVTSRRAPRASRGREQAREQQPREQEEDLEDLHGRDEVQRAYDAISPVSPKAVIGSAPRDDVLKMYMGKPVPEALPLDTPGPARYAPLHASDHRDFSRKDRSSAFSGERSDIRAGCLGSSGNLGPGHYEHALDAEAYVAPSSPSFQISTTNADDYDKLYTGNWAAKNGYRQSPEPGFKYSRAQSTMLDPLTKGPSFTIGKGPARGPLAEGLDDAQREQSRPRTAPGRQAKPKPRPYGWVDPERAAKAKRAKEVEAYKRMPHNLGKNLGPSPKCCKFAKESARPDALPSSCTPGPVYKISACFGQNVRGPAAFSKAKRMPSPRQLPSEASARVRAPLASLPSQAALDDKASSSEATDPVSVTAPSVVLSLTEADFDALDPSHALLELDNDLDSLLRGLRRRPPVRNPS